MVTEKVPISLVDYEELNSDHSRWTKEQYAYFAAKFMTRYPVEGYGMYGVSTLKDSNGCCYITWSHGASSD